MPPLILQVNRIVRFSRNTIFWLTEIYFNPLYDWPFKEESHAHGLKKTINRRSRQTTR